MNGYRRWKRFGFGVTLAAAMFAARSGSAQFLEFEDAEFFRPTTDAGDFIQVYDSDWIPPGKFTLGAYGDYARNPLEIQFEDSEDRFSKVVEQLGTIQAIGAIGVLDRFSLGVRVPGYILQTEDSILGSDGGTEAEFGDVSLNGTITLLSRQQTGGVGLAIVPEVTFPTGNRRAFAGTGKFGYGGFLVLDGAPTDDLRFGLNLGGFVRDEFGGGPLEDEGDAFNDQFRAGGAVAFDMGDTATAIVEAVAAADTNSPFDQDFKTPVDVLGALRFHLGPIDLTVGGGAGVTRGQGSPDFRVFLGVTPPKPPTDEVGPGVNDLGQSRKTFAVKDNDRDGRPSPGDAIEYRILMVNSGSATIENVTVTDAIPAQTRYVRGTIKIDGQPMTDGAGDDNAELVEGPSITFRLPQIEAAPGRNEIPLSFEVEIDREIRQLTTIVNQAYAEAEGIPNFPLPPTEVTVFPSIRDTERVVVTPDRIELTEDIHFEFDKAVIQRESFSILQELAGVLQQYPQLRIRVEGNTDSVGTESYNQKLSELRALAVRDFLVGAGISKDRLEHAGRGENNPIASNDTPTGRAKNRRTEFLVLNPDALGDKTIERKTEDTDLAPESEPGWLKRGERHPDGQ